jgi:hypothetical protein
MHSPSRLSLCVLPFFAASVALAQKPQPFCEQPIGRCIDLPKAYTYDKPYVGHDEPALLFYSNKPGSGNSNVYFLRLPKDPPTLPKQNGTGGTFNAQLHIAFWLGMAVCDTQSFPEYTSTCTPDSDSNIFDSPDADSPHYIGHHPGTAFMEMQLYPPGFVLWPPGGSCDATRWCAALNIFSLQNDPNNGLDNNNACLSTVGEETANFAFITKNGKPHGPANPLDATLATYTPNPNTDLFMNSGDVLKVELHDTSEGLEVVVIDLTTHEKGSMKASAENSFAQVKFDPYGTSCKSIPYDFHPMYSTSSEHTRVPWAAHSFNVAFSDEIGHFEYCSSVDANGNCTQPGADGDDILCFPASDSSRIPVGGCFGADLDFDSPPYRFDWPGTSTDPAFDREFHPQPIQFTSPLFKSKWGKWENYDRVAFETDLPALEQNCDFITGSGCENPPPGAEFYPIYSTGYLDPDHDNDKDLCFWQFGGTHIPRTTNTFGGTSTTEYGSLLALSYPEVGGSVTGFEDYRRVLGHNACEFAPHR